MADRVDAAVDLMEPSPPDAQVDCAHAEARPEQLLTRDQSVLLPRELPDHPVQAPRMQLTITMNERQMHPRLPWPPSCPAAADLRVTYVTGV